MCHIQENKDPKEITAKKKDMPIHVVGGAVAFTHPSVLLHAGS